MWVPSARLCGKMGRWRLTLWVRVAEPGVEPKGMHVDCIKARASETWICTLYSTVVNTNELESHLVPLALLHPPYIHRICRLPC
mmetsp:Transcript_35839/g.90313  ORF Transcript_35839/g.90313 Transcript_35839/m.90313 type:complete len:84 (-) Transcript_35839:932-1183(-)